MKSLPTTVVIINRNHKKRKNVTVINDIVAACMPEVAASVFSSLLLCLKD